MDTLVLKVTSFTDETLWSWQLTSTAGEFLASREVALDRTVAEYEGFVDLDGYLHWHAARGKDRHDRLVLEADVGRWIGAEVFGDVGSAIVARASSGPVVVRVVVPEEARVLFVRPFELAYVSDQPLALHGVSLVLEPADPGPGKAPRPGVARPDRPLRILAIFSLPEDEQALALRWERHQLTGLIRDLAEAEGAAIDLRVVQYGVTRERLADILSEPGGWDVIHVSGHGLPGGLFLEQADGGRDLIGSHGLIDLLGSSPSPPKLVTLASCDSAAAGTAAPLVQYGLSRASYPPGEGTAFGLASGEQSPMLADPSAATSGDGAAKEPLADAKTPPQEGRPLPTLASELARRLGCAVMAMRYRVSDEFAMQLTERVYTHMLVDRDSLPRALQRAVAALAPIGPALTVASAALFGSASATLELSASRHPVSAADVAVRRNKLADLPPQPERFVGRIGTMTRASSALAANNTARAVVFHGMPGVGKTACALELAHTHEDAFEEIVWYQVAKDADNPRQLLRAFLAFLHDRLPGIPEVPALVDGEAFGLLRNELSELLARRAILLVIDGIEALVTPGGSWCDEQWAALVAALVSHDGASRLVLTSRYRPPPIGSQTVIEPVCALSQFEGAILGLQFNEFRALLIGDAGRDSAEGAMLFSGAVVSLYGHPGLIDIAASLAGQPDELRRRLDAADQALEANRMPLTSFLRGEPTARADECLDAIESWTAEVRRSLPARTATFFDILCAVEEGDCGDFGSRIAWGEFWRLRGHDEPADFDEHLRVLQDVALIEVPHAIGEQFRTFHLHPAVAAAGRLLAGPELQNAVDQAMATFLYSGYFHTLKSKQDRFVVQLFGERAVPYLLRAGRLGDVSEVLMAVLHRDQSQEAIAQVLPLLRRVAAAAVGTSAELTERAHLAQAESLIHPEVAEAELRDLLRLAEDSQRTSLALTIMTDLTRTSRESGRLDEALSWADRAIALAQDVGSGPWMELRLEITRLQIQMLRGEAEPVLARVDELVTLMADLAEPEPGAESASMPPDIPWYQVWGTRETLLNTGMIAAGHLGRWEKMLAFSTGLIDSMAARGASPLDRASVEFMNYQPLIGMDRLGEARDLLRQCRDIFAEHHDDRLLEKAVGALSDVESRLGHHDIAIRLGEEALRLAYTSANVQDINNSHNNLARIERDDPAMAFAHELAAAIIAYQVGLGSFDTYLRALANRIANEPDRNPIPGSFAELCERVSQVNGVDLAGLLARLRPGRNGDEVLSEVLHAAVSIELPLSYHDPHLRHWDPVIAAMLAAGLGADSQAEPGDDRAMPWIERSLQARGSEDRWAALVRVLRRIVNGERDAELTEGLNPVDRAIGRRTLDALAGRATVSTQARSAWRILDYLDSRGLGQSGSVNTGSEQEAQPMIEPIADMLATSDDIDPMVRASLLFDLASRVANAGLHEDARAVLQGAVSVYRLLAEENPGKFGPDLATALSRLASELLSLGLGEEAVTAGHEALTIRRRLAATGSVILERDLAAGLNNLGGLLSRWHGPNQGLPLFRESAEIYRRLGSNDPGLPDPELITALRNMSTGLSALGCIEEALAAAQEAVEVARPLAESDPAAHEPALASALTDLESCRSRLGQKERAAATAGEAADLYRHLADEYGAAYEAGLAEALSTLGVDLSRIGRSDEGLIAVTEAVSILTRLSAVNPAAHEGDLAKTQNNLAVVLSTLGRPNDVVTALQSAAKIYRRLIRGNPAEFEPSLATTLNNLGIILAGQHEWREVQAVTAEAIPLQRRLTVIDPAVFEPKLALSLPYLASAYDALDEEIDEAVAAATESVDIYRRLADASPEAYSHQLKYTSLTLEKLLLERDQRFLESELSVLQAFSEQIERNSDPGEATAMSHQRAAPIFDPAVFGETAANAVTLAASSRRGATLDTRAVLLALMHVDALGDWSRIWLNARSPELVARAAVQDPDQTTDGHWGDAGLTGTLTSALLIATRISREYSLEPIPVGVLALGLIANPAAAAARALGVGDGIDHGLLVNLVQEVLIGSYLEDLDLTG